MEYKVTKYDHPVYIKKQKISRSDYTCHEFAYFLLRICWLIDENSCSYTSE